tara:strand:+ start:960 stop:1100 length:141 start_codon:yes stop_codon:yes gene_type:complete
MMKSEPEKYMLLGISLNNTKTDVTKKTPYPAPVDTVKKITEKAGFT